MKLFWNLSSTSQNKLLDFYLRNLPTFERQWYYFVTTEYQKLSWLNKGEGSPCHLGFVQEDSKNVLRHLYQCRREGLGVGASASLPACYFEPVA